MGSYSFEEVDSISGQLTYSPISPVKGRQALRKLAANINFIISGVDSCMLKVTRSVAMRLGWEF